MKLIRFTQLSFRATKLLLMLISCCPVAFSQEAIPLINSSVVIKEGLQLHDEGKYKEAIEKYGLVSSADSNYVLALYEKALSYQADSQFHKGMLLCQQALALKADREREPELFTLYGNILDNTGQSKWALAVYDSGISRYPAYTTLHQNKAICLLKQSEFKKAEQLLQQAILINPYNATCHYLLGVVAVAQGKVVPAFLTFSTYLLVSPDGKFSSKAINFLSSLAKNDDKITKYASNRTDDASDQFVVLEQIISSKIALDKGYKLMTKLDDPICRQMQVVFEKLEWSAADKDFYVQYYVPFYKKIFNEQKFEPLVFRMFSDVELDEIKSYTKKNKKRIEQLTEDAATYLSGIRLSRELNYDKRDAPTKRYYFDNGNLMGYGALNGDNRTGDWIFYYFGGNVKATGTYTDKGQRIGNWKYYQFSGGISGEETFENGELHGMIKYYHENGNPSLAGKYVNGKREGLFTRYTTTGSIDVTGNYKDGKLSGLRKSYYPSGVLKSQENYENDEPNGAYITWHNNGKKHTEGTSKVGKSDGVYRAYHDNGILSTEGAYLDGEQTGTWKRYHLNGKLKNSANYVKGKLDGNYEEYYSNGQLYTKYNNRQGKTEGEAPYYDKDGKLFSMLVFDNDKVKSARYFDKTGKEISVSVQKNNKIDLTTYNPEGFRRSQAVYDQKGNINGPRSYFFNSGVLQETENFVNGVLEGSDVSYYLNKNKRFQLNYKEGKKDGYYTSYYIHGAKESEGWHKNDMAEGVWLNYDPFGIVSTKTEYLNDAQHGEKISYWPNGKKESEAVYHEGTLETIVQYDTTGKVSNTVKLVNGSGTYVLMNVARKPFSKTTMLNGLIDGEQKYMHFNGTTSSISYYKKGLQDSIFRAYFYGGKPRVEGQYTLDKKSGTWTYYYSSGKIKSKEEYKDGELHGKRIGYFENGKVEYETEYEEGEKNGWHTSYNETGALMYKIKYKGGSPSAYTYLDKNNTFVTEIDLPGGSGKVAAYYPNGKPSAVTTYLDGVLHGDDNTWFADGKPAMISTESYGQTEGGLKYYNASGTLKTEFNFLHDELHGSFREFNEKGIITRQGNYYNGYLHGPVTIYDSTGKKKEVHQYYYGQLIEVKK